MATVAPRLPLTPLVLPVQHRQAAPASPVDSGPETDATALTIAMVAESETRWGVADLVAHLARLAVVDELVVVYGSDGYEAGSGAHPVVAGLRERLPRHTVVAIYVAPDQEELGGDVALVDELLNIGHLPIVITPAGAVPDVVAELYNRLRADRVLRVSCALADEADVQQVWRRRTTPNNQLVSCARAASLRRAG